MPKPIKLTLAQAEFLRAGLRTVQFTDRWMLTAKPGERMVIPSDEISAWKRFVLHIPTPSTRAYVTSDAIYRKLNELEAQ